MRKSLPISGVIGQGRSLNANSGLSVNCYIEVTAYGKPVLIGTPGLDIAFTLPNAPVRGCYADSETSFWVAGNQLFSRKADNTITTIGSIGTYNGTVKFASSGVDLMLVDGTAGWSYKFSTGVLTQITDPDFPVNPIDVKYLNGYFIVITKNTQQFWVSEKTQISTVWNALDFATAEGRPDFNAGIEIYQNELLIFGYKSLEAWGFTGNVDFPFERNSNFVLDYGIVAPRSVGKTTDNVLWLGGDNYGNGTVWQLSGYTPQRVSTHEIEQRIAKMPYINDAFAMTYHQEGHMFYILQFPSANDTLVYDITTQQWHIRNYRETATGDLKFWRGSCMCFSGSKHFVGDMQTGNVYNMDLDIYDDNGDEIPRIRTSTALNNDQYTIFYNEIIIYMETGVGLNVGQGIFPKLKLRYSNDSGHSWSNWRESSIGRIGQYNAEVKFNMLGSGRNRVWEIYLSDPVKFVVLGAVVDYKVGLS